MRIIQNIATTCIIISQTFKELSDFRPSVPKVIGISIDSFGNTAIIAIIEDIRYKKQSSIWLNVNRLNLFRCLSFSQLQN